MSEQKLEIFNVLNYLSRGYELENILKEGTFGTFPSAQDCIKYLVDEGYLEGEFDDGSSSGALTAEEISKKYTVAELKDILRENGLKVSGKKQELVERVWPVLNDDSSEPASKDVSYDLELTQKAKEFLDENQWIDLYMFAIAMFRFDDYETYVNNSSEDMIQTAHNFCDEVISKALMANQFLIFIDGLSAKAHVFAYVGDYESFLDYDLQRFILGLNPIFMDAQSYATYDVVNYANILNLKNVTEKLDLGSLKKRFDRIWVKSNIKNTTVPKKTAFKILQNSFAIADEENASERFEELNFDLKEKYFDKKFGI
ncbi:SAP domain-containing protein [Methanobrevibacter sp.]|uniref:SAP domain-containing protein n=1 Tax=Methanobrevibacter sp. TaxID=66852 RepID=UPI003890182E